MTTAATVPVTREEELEGDEALETLRRCGRRRLALDSVERFRAADGFSHSRALAFQLTLTFLPALIAIVGLAGALDVESFGNVVRDTISELLPGAIGELFTEALRQGDAVSREESGELALAGGGFAALLAGTTAMAQVERGANRIYGTERDRPFLQKYSTALVLAVTAGTAGLLSVSVLVGGSAIRSSIEWSDAFDTVWVLIRWPLGIALSIVTMALLFEYAPRRRQPEPSWLAFGAALSALLWLVFMAVLVAYVELTGTFGATYGPLAGTIGVLLWTFLSSVALFLGIAFAAQLEAVRAGKPEPSVDRDGND